MRDALLREVEQFLFREARLADEHAYEEWEALWTDDGSYWVPAGGDGDHGKIAVIDDNRSRIALRVSQLETGKRHSQRPLSSVRRLLSNIELLGVDGDEVDAGANFMAVASRLGASRTWAGRAEYRLRRVGGDLKMVRKKVLLVDREE
ncbi:MAG: aromatic-ring-hydroxylating dioxygenase subunit beta, partial [Acidimicrobiales bacterium]